MNALIAHVAFARITACWQTVLHLDLREHGTVFHATARPVWDPGVVWGVWAQLVVRIASHVHPSYRSAHTRSAARGRGATRARWRSGWSVERRNKDPLSCMQSVSIPYTALGPSVRARGARWGMCTPMSTAGRTLFLTPPLPSPRPRGSTLYPYGYSVPLP